MNCYDVTLYNDSNRTFDKIVIRGLVAPDKDAARAFGEAEARRYPDLKIVVHVAWIGVSNGV